MTYALARVAAGDEGAWRRRYPADRLRTRPTVYVRGMPQLGSAECAPTGSKHGSSIGSSNSFAPRHPPAAQEVDPGDTASAMAEPCRVYYVDRLVSRAAFLSARARLARRADGLSRQTGRRPEVARVLAAANPAKSWVRST